MSIAVIAAVIVTTLAVYLYKVLERRGDLEPIDAGPGIAPH